MTDSVNMKRRLEKKRRKRSAEDESKKLSDDMIRLYVAMLKHKVKYNVECRESLLSPGCYMITLSQYWVPFGKEKQKIVRDTFLLRPVIESNVRF